MRKVDILGVSVNTVSKKKALEKFKSFLSNEQKNYIVTPNPEIVLKAQKNFSFKEVLNKSSLAIPDGTGLKWAASFLADTYPKRNRKYLNILFVFLDWVLSAFRFVLSKKYRNRVIKERVTGADMFWDSVKICEQKKCSLYLLGARDGIAQKVAKKIKKKYPNFRIAGTYSGSPHHSSDEKMRYLINDSKADVLLVAYGAPLQEFWIQRNVEHLHTIKCAMAVGGTFDFIAGKTTRAPKKYQQRNIEWLWRLRNEPQRAKRIWNAVVKFPYYVFLEKIQQKRPYRKNVIAVIINKNKQFLLLNRINYYQKDTYANHWQFLQGGKRIYESDEEAVLREAKEEMGSSKLEIIDKADKVYTYDWPITGFRIKRPYRGQRQTIWFLKYTGDNSDINVNPKEHSEYKWISKNDILTTIHPIRHGSAKIILDTMDKKKILNRL
ncbi:WecB/TagA/CpsF family glycosyltransferase [Patescibacteria group bacterium]|nr:WecB/TagA/CpsF family glycosyltransferase [Patescibacteria group bacterium]